MELIGEVLLYPGDLVGGHVIGDVQLAATEPLELGARVLGGVEYHRIDTHVGRVPVVRVALQADVALRHPFGQAVGAVGDQVAGPGPLVSVALQRLGMHGIRVRVREHSDEVGRRRLQGHLQGVRVDGFHPEPVQFLDLALGDLLAVGDGPEDECVARAHRRIHSPPQREDEVVSRDRIAVGPLGVLAEVERIDLAVVAQGPALRHARDQGTVRGFCHETLEEVALDAGSGHSGRLVHVQGLRLRAVASLECVLDRMGGGDAQQQCGEERDEERPD